MGLNIREWNGTPIAEPGVYRNVPISVYHGPDLCIGPSIGSSSLREIELTSPSHYWSASVYNPARIERPSTQALNFGSAAHTLLLGETDFERRYAIRPDHFRDFKTKAAREWRDLRVKMGKIPILEEEIEAIHRMAAVMRRDPMIANGLLAGDIELTIVWRDEKTGFWLKARPDALPALHIASDIKTAKGASARACSSALGERGYHMQGALVRRGLQVTADVDLEKFVLIFVEKDEPHAINIKDIDADAMYWGGLQLRRAVDTFAECMQTGVWPGYKDNGEPVSLPRGMVMRLKDELTSGILTGESI